MKVYWHNTGTARPTILDFDENLHEIFNQQRRVQTTIFGIAQVVGERIAQSETYDSIEICAHLPYNCSFTVFLDDKGIPRPVVKASFEPKVFGGPAYSTEVEDLESGRSYDNLVAQVDLAREIVSWVAAFLASEIPNLHDAFTRVYGERGIKLPGELDPEFWTVKPRRYKFQNPEPVS